MNFELFYIQYAALVTLLLVFVYNIFVFKQLPKILKVFSVFVFFSFVFQLVGFLMAFFQIGNLFLIPFFSILGTILLSLFYKKVFEGFINGKIIDIVLFIYVLVNLIYLVFFSKKQTFHGFSLTTESILVLVYSSFTFIILLNEIVKAQRTDVLKSLNWINIGLFLYYTSSLMIFYFGDTITQISPSPITQYTWILHALFSVVMYICFFLGLWNRPRHFSS